MDKVHSGREGQGGDSGASGGRARQAGASDRDQNHQPSAGPVAPAEAATAANTQEPRAKPSRRGKKSQNGQRNPAPKQTGEPQQPQPQPQKNRYRRKTQAIDGIDGDQPAAKPGLRARKNMAETATNWRARPAKDPLQAQDSNQGPEPAADAPQPKPPRRAFADHYAPKKVDAWLAAGRLVRGVLRINPRNTADAYVSLDQTPSAQAQRNYPELSNYVIGSSDDIYLGGSECRNRAISGDIVAVKILTAKAAQRVYARHRRGGDRRMDKMAADRRARMDRMADSVRAVSANMAPDDVTPCEASSEDSLESAENGRTGARVPALFGTVMAIITPNSDRTFVGTLSNRPPVAKGPSERDSQLANALWFRPLDKALPIMFVPKASVAKQPRTNEICAVHMGAWDAASLYPSAKYLRSLGERGSLEIETELILEENSVSTEAFAPGVLRCLPKTPWRIPSTELKCRTDLRQECVFSIDPPTARDLDDAVSCRELPNGNVLIGVHIADVSYFVRPRTALDRMAQQRATTTYMVQRAYPMLPSVLCEDLCSLNAGVDRLAFSVMWEIEPATATVCSTWFGRTVISSACKLSYDDAQHVIDGGHLSKSIACFEHNGARTRPASAQRRDEIEASIGWFYRLSLIMRKRRFDTGALSLHSVRLSFELDDAGQPVACQPYAIKDSNRLIEEFMLLANMSVAARIEASFPDSALLRRHAPPLERRLEDVCRQLAHAGIEIDTQSAGTISDSIRRISDADTRYTVEEMLTQPMQRAAYFSTHAIEDRAEYRHYALNAPLYTHFTSPIRRYADVIVHRLLEASLAVHGNHVTAEHALLPPYYSPFFPRTNATGSLTTAIHDSQSILVPAPELLAIMAHQCNLRKDAAKKAQDASSKLFLVNYLAATALRTGAPGVITQAIVTKVGENGISFVTPMFGVDGIIYMDRIADRKNQVVSADGREWKLHLWSVKQASVTLVWTATPDPKDQLASKLSALVIDDTRHAVVGFQHNGAVETVTQTYRIFNKISVCIIPETNPPDLTVKLVMPGV
ncbi:hypothetical protein IWW55_000800 [Coemansia sp. RSA 2706]|nr:hypothetical protein IWW55_000800 [Coemansia sp. RSA 2706]